MPAATGKLWEITSISVSSLIIYTIFWQFDIQPFRENNSLESKWLSRGGSVEGKPTQSGNSVGEGGGGDDNVFVAVDMHGFT